MVSIKDHNVAPSRIAASPLGEAGPARACGPVDPKGLPGAPSVSGARRPGGSMGKA